MWAFARRTGLFVVSYAPLAAMFAAVEWPRGWGSGELGLLAVWLVGVSGLLVFPLTASFFSPGRRKRTLGVFSLAAAALTGLGAYYRWYEPMAWDAPPHHTRATAAAIAFALCVAGVAIAVVIVLNARQGSELRWRVTDPRDQGGAVAAYLATYLLPLISLNSSGWNTVIAYLIYLGVVYVIFVRSENLVLVNPTLYVLGFRIFDVQLDPPDEVGLGLGRRRVLLLTRTPITRTTEVDVLPLGDDCYLTAKGDKVAA